MSGNRIIFFGDPIEGLRTYKNKEDFFKHLFSAIDQKGIQVEAHPNGDVCNPALNIHIILPKPAHTLFIEPTAICKLTNNGLERVFISKEEYDHVLAYAEGRYEKTAKAMALFNKIFTKNKA